MGQNIEVASLRTIIDDLQRRVYALEHAPRLTSASLHRGTLAILDDDKDPLARLGVLPDNRVAQAFYDPSGNELIRLGEQSDGRFGQDVNSPTGTRVLRLGQLPDGTYGLAAYDDGGNERVRFGQLPGGGYGARIGLGVSSDDSAGSRTEEGWGPLTTGPGVGPSVTVRTGTRALVWTGCMVQAGTNPAVSRVSSSGYVSYRISGATNSPANEGVPGVVSAERWSTFSIAINAVLSAGGSVGRPYLQTGLTPGDNTFTLEYLSGSTDVLFSHRTIAVLPL